MKFRVAGFMVEADDAAIAGVEKDLILRIQDEIDSDGLADALIDICADVIDPGDEANIDRLNELNDEIWEHVVCRVMIRVMGMVQMGQRMGSDGTVRTIGRGQS